MALLTKKSRRLIKRRLKVLKFRINRIRKVIRNANKIKRNKIILLKFKAKKSRARYNKRYTEDERKNILCMVVLAMIGLGLAVNISLRSHAIRMEEYSTKLPESTILESRVLFAGDVYWGRNLNKWAQETSLKEAYPFRHLGEFKKDSYDAWVANLECPSVPGVQASIKDEKEKLIFNCPVSYLSEASKWFNVFSLANNHTNNYKDEEGLLATRKVLDDYAIQYFGHFDPSISTDACEVIAIPARVRLDDTQKKVKIPVAMCGFAGVNYKIKDKDLEPIKLYAKYMPVIVMPHMGVEYSSVVDAERQALYRKMIDYGADIVLGNHPHWVQPTEVYKGKLIAYSMGNFIFDQQFSEEVTRSAAISLTMSIDQSPEAETMIQSWVSLGERCATFHDDCFDQIKTSNLGLLPFKFKFSVIGVQTSNKTTKPSNQRTYNMILDRLRWNQTQNELSASNYTVN